MRTTIGLAAIALAFGCNPMAPAPHIIVTRDYFAAKARYNSVPRQTPEFVATALKDLEARARSIIGPIEIQGDSGHYNPQWLSNDPGGYLLDGLAFTDSAADRTIIATTRELIAGWLSTADSGKDPLVEVAHEDRLTWLLLDNSHNYEFADLRGPSIPASVFLAQLGARSNDIPFRPSHILVGVRDGHRVFFIFAPPAATLSAPESCGSPMGDSVYRACFNRHAPAHPDFPRLGAQVRELAALVVKR